MSSVCFGQQSHYICNIPSLMEIVNGSQKYLTATPSWSVTAGSESRELDGMLLKSEQINSTAYKLVVNVTRELFNGSNLSVICYLILNDEQYSKDESVPVILSPLGVYFVYTISMFVFTYHKFLSFCVVVCFSILM